MKSTMSIDQYGNRHWRNDVSKFHREEGPAIEWVGGSKSWWFNGKLHRTDGPAVEWASEQKEWWINGERHRTDGPAVEYPDGTKLWWLNGKLFSVTEEWARAVLKLNGKEVNEDEVNNLVRRALQPYLSEYL